MKKFGPRLKQHKENKPEVIDTQLETKSEIITKKRVNMLAGAYKSALKGHEDAKKRANDRNNV